MAENNVMVIPDIGGAEDAEVIEISVKPGDQVQVEDTLITLEGDKATMDIPASEAGTVEEVLVNVGDKVKEGTPIVKLTAADASSSAAEESEVEAEDTVAAEATATNSNNKKSEATATAKTMQLIVPDLGDAKDVEVIEVAVQVGDQVAAEETLLTLEGDKATMEVPAPEQGEIAEWNIKVGDKVSSGDVMGSLQLTAAAESATATSAAASTPAATKSSVEKPADASTAAPVAAKSATAEAASLYAGPAVRRLARELNIDLQLVTASGDKGRISKDDLNKFIKARMTGGAAASAGGLNLVAAPAVDFSKFGAVTTQPLSKIQKLSGRYLHRNWVQIPHVTQFESVDITELEAFRSQHKEAAKKQGVRLTPLVFIMKAVAAALKAFPTFNASLSEDGESLILKQYYHVGVAVDTPNGLVVPVIRDVDKKSLLQLAEELGAISEKARTKGLSMQEMQGGCFTISSLGGIGGTAFTPIVNAPEVAILGVSKSSMQPVYQEGEFVPRLMLPLSLSYDHRVIDGAVGARFIVYLASRLADIRTLIL